MEHLREYQSIWESFGAFGRVVECSGEFHGFRSVPVRLGEFWRVWESFESLAAFLSIREGVGA